MVLCNIEVKFLDADFLIENVERDGYSIDKLLSDCYSMVIKTYSLSVGEVVEASGVVPESGKTWVMRSDHDVCYLLSLYDGIGSAKVQLQVVPYMPQDPQVTNEYSENQEGNRVTDLEFNPFGDEYIITDDEEENESVEDYNSGSDDRLSEIGTNDELEVTNNFRSEKNSMSRLAKEMKGHEFKTRHDGHIEFRVGHVFENISHFREVLKDYTIQEGFEPDRKKNEKKRITCKCKGEGCEWRIHASLMPDQITFQVKTYNPVHTCLRHTSKNKEATSTWIAKKFERELGQNPDKPIEELAEDLKYHYKIEVNDQRLFRARHKGKKNLEGDHSRSYNMLPSYKNIIMQYNPGSLAVLSFQDRYYNEATNKLSAAIFKRFFLAFPIHKNSFLNGCRPFIGLDGCFLKGPYKGMLLSAVTLDGNSGIIPLAIMVAEGETKDSWGEFLDCLEQMIGQCTDRNLTFMSDRQKGILDAISKHFPKANNRYCAMHMLNNFQAKFPGIKLRYLFWAAVRATTEADFLKNMNEIKSVSKEAYLWMAAIPPEHWALYTMSETIKSNHVTNNMSESFNSWLLKNRAQPILTLCENFRRRVMKRFGLRKEKALNWGTLVTPYVRRQLETNKKNSRECMLTLVGGGIFEVYDKLTYYVVNLLEKTCNCRAWALSGIPCRHAILAILWQRGDLEKYCDTYLTTETYLTAYSENIKPLPDQSMWPTVEHDLISPPIVKRSCGRPKKKRKRSQNEQSMDISRSSISRCRKCKEIGHNKRTCPAFNNSSAAQGTS